MERGPSKDDFRRVETLPDPQWPEGHVPLWWHCEECGAWWHDREQDDPGSAAWDMEAFCAKCGLIEMTAYPEIRDPASTERSN